MKSGSTRDETALLDQPISRRTFLGLTAGTAAAFTLGGKLAGVGADGLLSPEEKLSHLPPVVFDREVHSLCEQCVWRCGLVAKVKDGKVYKLDGNPHHSHSNGMLCPRGQAGVATLYDPDRLLYPMIRAGERGSGQWQRVSWDQALDYVAQRMLEIKEKYGSEAMIFSTTHNLIQTQFENLLKAYGSPNYGTQRSLCFNAMIVANLLTYGLEEPGRDYSAAQYIIYTGRNLLGAISNSESQALVAALARGTKVVVLDPRFTRTAAKATDWLPVKPGADLAFHLAMIHEIIFNDLYDKEFVDQYTVGFDELKEAVRAYTPEWAATKTEILAGAIRRIAHEFALAAPHAFAHPNWRTSNFVNSFQTERAIAILNALVGNWGQPGGLQPAGGEGGGGLGRIPQPPYPRVSALRLDGLPWKYPLVPFKLGVFQEIRDNVLSGEPYQAHGWFIYRQNPVNSLPERRKTLEAFSKLDFIVTIDISLNDTAWFSDVVLPEASYLERYDPLAVVDGTVFIRQPAVEPLGESKSGLWIFKQLGERLGLGDYFQYEDEEDYLRQQLEPLDITLEDLKQRGFYRLPEEHTSEESLSWNTASGKVELASEVLRNAGFPAVPTWEAPPEAPEGQFYLLTGKVAQHTQFATHNNKLLHERAPANPLWIHPQAAAVRGIADGDEVWVESAAGKVKTRVHVTERIRPDCVYMTPGFGHVSKALRTAYGAGASDSDLHLTFTDPISGSQALSQTTVKVTKA
ncbi:MAG: molybdopterin-dependent oxidoreductase [Anaerolineae bacterium]